MTLVTATLRFDRFRASRVVAATAAVALLGLVAALPMRLEAQCTLQSSGLVSFEPNPPGVSRGGTPFLGSGFNSALALYKSGTSGPYRLLMSESYGYSVLDLTNPVNPTALYYHDVRFPLGGPNSVTHHGDGQSDITTIAVSPDGFRAAFSTGGPAFPFQTVVGSPDGVTGFTLWGDFFPDRANSTLIQHIGSRYIAYDIHPSLVTASDITTLPTGSLVVNNLVGATETTTWPGGGSASLAGNYVLFQAGGAIQVIDASNPGPIGNITAAYPQTTITSADFVGGHTIAYYSAAVDPTDPTKLWVLVELNAKAGENSPSYGLLSVTSGLAKVSAGPIWRVPSQSGDLWWANPGISSALVPGNGGLFVLMWAQRASPSLLFELYSTTTAAWAFANSSAPPGKFDIPPAFYSNFSAGYPMRGFGAASGNSVYAYLPTGTSAYMIPMSCVSQNAPAVASLTVANQAGAALNNGDTVFVGDLVTITPTVNPSTTSQPLTGFGWNFDFDFHAGAASEDNGVGTSPRIKAPDNGAFGNPSTPPATIAVVGPCDPQVGGTSPGSGAGCWTSATTNGAFGGPDFAAAPVTGSTKALSFAFEANNALGSAGASLFTLNWKVPAAKIQTNQILSGGALTSASDGHPTAYQWSFGPDAQNLTPACTTSACVPPAPFNAKGTYAYSLTAKYFVDQTFATSVTGSYTVTDFAQAFTVNGATSGPITVVTNQSLTVSNSSQRGAGVTAAYSYSLCDLNGQASCTDNYILWTTMLDAPPSGTPPTTATIPLPAAAGSGSWALKLKANYTGGTAFWPDPNNASYFSLHLVTVQPLVVTATVSPTTAPIGTQVTFSCSATGGLAPYSYQWRSPITFVVGTQQTYQTSSAVAGNIQAYCFVTDSQAPTPQSSSASATAAFTGTTPVSVNVQASTTNAPVGTTVYFTCSASGGGGGPFTYVWSGNAVSGIGATAQQTFTAGGTYNAVCTATDSVSGGAGIGSKSVVITGGGGGGFAVNVSVSPNPGTVNQNVTFSCNVSGGSGSYTYQWRSPATSTFVAGTSPTFSTISTVPISIEAGCTATDTAGGASTGNKATVIINDAAPPAAACADVDFHLVDVATGLAIPISGNFLGQYFSVQTGQQIRFIATTQASFTSLAWDFGDGGTGSGNSAVYSFPASGSPTVRVTVDGNSASCTKSYLFLVSGPSGLFTAQYADGSLFSSTHVESGKAMTFTASADGADSYAWTFGDGFTATGKATTHAFTALGTTNVTYTTTLTVTIGAQNLVSSQAFTVIPPPEPPKWFVAGLAYVKGSVGDTVWQSDLTVLNPHPTVGATYSLAFVDGSAPVAPADLEWKTITLGPQRSASASNVLGTFFGKSLGSYGAVIVRGDVAPVAPAITSRTYNNGNPGRGTFGFSVPTTQATSGVSPQSSAAQQLLIGLREDDSAYTNIFLLNLISTDWSHAHLTFFDEAGASLGVINVDVPPYGVAPLSKPVRGDGWLHKPPQAVYRVQVAVEPGGAVYPYATVIDQTSTDSIVVTPTEQPLNTYRVPGIVRLVGANNTVWRSRFVLHNPSTSPRKVKVRYSYVPCYATGCLGQQSSSGPGDVSMAPGETKTWDDFPSAWLAAPGESLSDSVSYSSSFVDVAPATGDANQDPLLVLGETFNSQPTGPVGLQVSGFTDLDAGSKTGAGKRLLLTGLASSSDFRTNVAFFLTSGISGRFNFRVLSDTGVTLRTLGWDLTDSNPFKQFGDAELFGGLNKSDRMSIIVDSFDGSPVAAYATIIDNTSGDATFVKAQPAP